MIAVAAGCIVNAQGDVLICQRPPGKIAAGKWEFPGGKIEPGETSRQALDRELQEELGLRVREARPLMAVTHGYSDRRVILHTWLVREYEGEPKSHEGQALAWVRCDDLLTWDLLAADRPIVTALTLPTQYVFTPPVIAEPALLQGLEHLPVGALLRLRLPTLDEPGYERCARAVLDAGRCRQLRVVLDRAPQQVQALGAAGWHASAMQLRRVEGRPVPERFGFFASCHTIEEVEAACAVGVDAAVVGPLAVTPSHPGQSGMGWSAFKTLAQALSRPTYAIGGVGPTDLTRAWQSGAQGVAGIQAYWGGGNSVTTMGSSVLTR